MTVLNFPPTTGEPTDGSFQYTENNITYVWNGSYWSSATGTSSDLDNRYLNSTGPETLTGDLTITGDLDLGVAQGPDTTAITAGTLYIITGNSDPVSPGQFTGAGAPDGNIGTVFLATGTVTLTGGNTVATAQTGGDISPLGDLDLGGDADIAGSANIAGSLAVQTADNAVFSIGQDIDGSGQDHLGMYYGDQIDATSSADIFTSNGDIRIRTDGNGAATTGQVHFIGGFGSNEGSVQITPSTGDVQMTSQNGGQLAGFRNQIINGAFEVNQRGNTTFSGSTFTADRWYMGQNSGTGESSLVTITDLPGFASGIQKTSAEAYIQQPVELNTQGSNSQFYIGSQWTHSFYSTDNTLMIAVGEPYGAFRVNRSSNDGAIEAGDVTSATVEQVGSSSWYRHAYTFTVTGDVSTSSEAADISVLNVNTMRTAVPVNTTVTGVQLEPGPVATPFEFRPIAVELELCRRYCYRFEYGARDTIFNFQQQANTTEFRSQMITLPTPMRVFPSSQGFNMETWRVIAGGSYDINFDGVHSDLRGIPFTNISHVSLNFERVGFSGSWDTTYIRANYNGNEVDPPVLPPYIIFTAEL